MSCILWFPFAGSVCIKEPRSQWRPNDWHHENFMSANQSDMMFCHLRGSWQSRSCDSWRHLPRRSRDIKGSHCGAWYWDTESRIRKVPKIYERIIIIESTKISRESLSQTLCQDDSFQCCWGPLQVLLRTPRFRLRHNRPCYPDIRHGHTWVLHWPY